MVTVAQAFQQFLTKLELTDAERADAVRQHDVVRANLRAQLPGGVDTDFLTGSYMRRTAIRPLNDIDVFLVMNESRHGHLRGQDPSVCLDMVRGALDRAYQNKVPTRPQGRSVNIAFSGTGIGYDIVPAFAHASGGYLIPDRERRTWIRTDPHKHEEILLAANQRAGGMLNPLIKAAKRWRDRSETPLGSFHLEVMAYEAFVSAPRSYADGLGALFVFLYDRTQRSCADPARLGANVDAGVASQERDATLRGLHDALTRSARALAFDSVHRTEEAHGLWRSLLGEDYREKGI